MEKREYFIRYGLVSSIDGRVLSISEVPMPTLLEAQKQLAGYVEMPGMYANPEIVIRITTEIVIPN